ncbi:MAG: Trm112 family protein [Candidatus Acidiferrales bacterium]
MRLPTLDSLICANCGGALALSSDSVPAEPDGHIISGELSCAVCFSKFPIRNGVPILQP